MRAHCSDLAFKLHQHAIQNSTKDGVITSEDAALKNDLYRLLRFLVSCFRSKCLRRPPGIEVGAEKPIQHMLIFTSGLSEARLLNSLLEADGLLTSLDEVKKVTTGAIV